MSQRSHWGWGLAEKFPDAAARRAIGEHAKTILGLPIGEPSEPVPLEKVSIRPPRVAAPPSLHFITTDREARIRHTYGRAYRDIARGFAGDFTHAPDAIAYPADERELIAALEWAERASLAVVPFGGGTSVVSGLEHDGARFEGVLTIDLAKLDRVLEVDPVSRAARIQAGALGPALEAQLGEHGLTLRHFPQSFQFSSLGGWIATRAGGHYATGYTHIDDLVESTRTITATGAALETRRLPASGAGPAPDRWMLGSEGILGVITEAWVRVQKRPRSRVSASVRFREWNAAVDATRAIAQSWLFPTNCRLLDPTEALQNGVVTDGSSVLVLAFESSDAPRDAWIERALAICAAHGGSWPEGVARRETSGTASDAGERWKQAFVDAPYLQNVMVSLGMIADTFETACTWDRFPSLHREIVTRVSAAMKDVAGGGRVSCRFTHVYPDGPAPYYTFLCPAGRGDELEQWSVIKHAASEAIAQCGATITHHHAVGRMHRPQYEREAPAPFLEALRAAKRALDPSGRMNPGVLIDP